MTTRAIPNALSERVGRLRPSLIREVAESAMGREDVEPLWFGESGWPTSDVIVQAGLEAMREGDHFYTPNSGVPTLRMAITRYLAGIHDRTIDLERITVTASAMQGLALVAQAIVTVGDRIVTLEPGWPNVSEAFAIAGGVVSTVPIRPAAGRWTVDIDELVAALGRGTRAVVINSPNNPTGWTMARDEQSALLAHCRREGIWIVADEVYARLYRHGEVAPSFIDIAEPDDRVIVVNSFSKAWSMTGWRLGWVVAPAAFEAPLAMLTEFNIAGPAGFVQAAGTAALTRGSASIDLLCQRLKAGYSAVEEILGSVPEIEFMEPDGAFYCFFHVPGMSDSAAVARHLVERAGVGLAPGRAFGANGEGYLRLCYSRPVDRLVPALERLARELPKAVSEGVCS